jgi:mono/diheme cytochrome c family protein
LILAALLLIPAFGCVQEMANQARVDTYEPHPGLAGSGILPQPANTIARGQNWENGPDVTGLGDDGPIDRIPIEVTPELMEQGRKHFGIYCSHCHGASGYGDGMVVQRGFPSPPSYHTDRLREVPDGHIFGIVTNGTKLMPSLGARIPREQRWAIVAYVRALQLSQQANLQDLSEADRQEIENLPTQDTQTQP